MAIETDRLPGSRIPSARQSDLTARARAAAEVAKANATAVDAEARFPSEAFAELRKQRLLGIQVPQSLDGEGATIAEIADVCYILGQACSSAGLIYAMHQIKMACIVRHFKNNPALERILRRIAEEQLLMASSTTEGQAGGNVRSSEAAVEHDGAQITLERKATVISYAVEADGIVTTARRAADATSRDDAIHTIRKRAKRLRYTAAATGANKVSKRAKKLQSLLGDHQDSVVSRAHLTQQADAAYAAGEDTFTYGLLYRQEADVALSCRRQLEPALRKLDKSVRKLSS